MNVPFRVKSRCVEITFKRPKVGPSTAEERKQRHELETGMSGGQFSSALGWIVSLGKELDEELQTSPRFQMTVSRMDCFDLLYTQGMSHHHKFLV